jgi:hypothetical protein
MGRGGARRACGDCRAVYHACCGESCATRGCKGYPRREGATPSELIVWLALWMALLAPPALAVAASALDARGIGLPPYVLW